MMKYDTYDASTQTMTVYDDSTDSTYSMTNMTEYIVMNAVISYAFRMFRFLYMYISTRYSR